MTWQDAARQLGELLSLDHAPIGIARIDAPPAGAARAGRDLPSACAYWREGEHRLVFATADDHKNCPIGMLTMGFEPAAEVMNEAQILVGNMAELGYLDPSEVAHLPMLSRGHAGVLYGPVRDFPVQPEIVLLICTPALAMLVTESLGRASLEPESARPIFGRPACSVIPRALESDLTEMSFACKGARVLAELTPSEMLVALPGASLESVVEALTKTISANTGMEALYREKQQRFAASH